MRLRYGSVLLFAESFCWEQQIPWGEALWNHLQWSGMTSAAYLQYSDYLFRTFEDVHTFGDEHVINLSKNVPNHQGYPKFNGFS
jgi:hypothetical protein